MLRKIIATTTALAVAWATTAPLPSQARPTDIPVGHIWNGIMGCEDGFRFMRLVTFAIPAPIYLIEYGARHFDGSAAGLEIVKPHPSGDKTAFSVERILVPSESQPTALVDVWNEGGGSIKGTAVGIPGCFHFQVIEDDTPAGANELRQASADPKGYLASNARDLIELNKPGHTAEDWAKLALIMGAFGLMLGQASGMVSSPTTRNGLRFSAPSGDSGSGSDSRERAIVPQVGGNVHGNGSTDVHGNPWGGN